MMKRVLSTVLASLLFLSIPVFAADWFVVAANLNKSVVAVQIGERGSCSGFVIDNERDFVLTAAHCSAKGEDLYVDLAPAKIRAKDTKNDLMVLEVEGIDRPAMKLANKDPKVGMEVASLGWGYGLNEPLFRLAHVSAVGINLRESGDPYIAIDATFVPGQSGGPVVNEKGEVLMLVQMGTEIVGFGVGAERIEKSLGKYFEGRGEKEK